MSLADERRAIRENVAATRAPTAGAQRRAIGQRLEAERRGAQVVEDLQRLQRTPQQRRTLRTVPPVGAVPASRGRGSYVPPPANGGGGGLVSPIIEESRTLHPPRVFRTSDGLLTFSLQRTDELRSVDAEGTVEIRRFADAP